jgi:uncharacterized membrane protein YqiK
MVNTPVLLMTVMMFIMIIALMLVYAASYKKFPPNMMAVITRGDPRKGNASYQVLDEGGKFVFPGAGKVTLLYLNAFLAKFVVDKVPTASDGQTETVRLNVAVIWKITSSREDLKAAAEGLVARTKGENEMAVKEHVETALMTIGPEMTADAFRGDISALSAGIHEHASVHLASMGLEIRSFHILDVHPQA